MAVSFALVGIPDKIVKAGEIQSNTEIMNSN